MKNLEAINQINLFHGDSDGFICMFQKLSNGSTRQYHYKYSELLEHVHEWQGNDVYITLNTFKTPRRANNNIWQFKALYVDLDTYKTDFTNEQILMHLEADYYNTIIPKPNAVIHSGRGLCLVFLLNYAPKHAFKRWDYAQRKLLEILEPFGADKAVKDPARILRLAGTCNSKNGAMVNIDYLHNDKYELADIVQDFFPYTKKAPKAKRKVKSHGGKSIYSLYQARAKDLVKLVELRKGHVVGYREKILFLYRYYNQFIIGEQKAMEAVLHLNGFFVEPLSRNEAINSTKSAITACFANKADRKHGYNYSNASLIAELDITPEEQKHLSTIISQEEKHRRQTIKRRKKHLSWADHLKRLADRRKKDISRYKRYIALNPTVTNKEAAAYMQCSVRKIQMIKAEIRLVIAVKEKVKRLRHNLKDKCLHTLNKLNTTSVLLRTVPLLE